MKTDEAERAQIRGALGALGDLAQPAPSFERLRGAMVPRSRRRPARWLVAAAVVAVGTTATALLVDDGGEGHEGVVAGPDADIAAAPGWTRLPDPPLSPRNSTTSVWTGEEIIVVGGWEFDCPAGADCGFPADLEPFSDGAAFDPVASAWRPIAEAPFGFTTSSAVTIGGDVFILTDRALLRYRTDADSWDEIPLPPGEHGQQLVAAPELDALVVASGSDEQGERPDWMLDLLDTRTNWSELPDDPLPPSYDRTVLWDGRDLLVFGKSIPERADSELTDIAGARWEDGTWLPLPASGTSGYQAWFVDGIVVVNPHFSASAGGGIFDPLTGTWSGLPPHPAGDAWNGDMAGVLGHDTAVLGDSGSWLLDVTAMRWIELTPPDDDTDLSGVATAVERGRFVIGGSRTDALALHAWLWTPPVSAAPEPSQPALSSVPFTSTRNSGG
jgi:hypothetical protein